MGRIFSPQEVENRRVPTLGAFAQVREHVEQMLSDAPAVFGAVIFGSVLAKPSQRSDFDLFVLGDRQAWPEVVEVVGQCVVWGSSLFVPVNPSMLDNVVAGTPLHHLDAGFYHHLEWAAQHGGVVKRDPLARVWVDHFDVKAATEAYLRHKYRRLTTLETEYPTLGGEGRYKALQTVMDTPWHVARKMLHHVEVRNCHSKKDVLSSYQRYFPRLADFLEQHDVAEASYNAALTNNLNRYRRANYAAAIEAVEQQIAPCREFVRANLMRLV